MWQRVNKFSHQVALVECYAMLSNSNSPTMQSEMPEFTRVFFLEKYLFSRRHGRSKKSNYTIECQWSNGQRLNFIKEVLQILFRDKMIFFHVKLRSFTHNLLLKTFWHFHLKISYLIFSFFSFSFPSFKVHQKYQFFFFLCFHLPIVYNVCCCQMLNTTRLVISEISETETRNRTLPFPAQLSLTC